MSGCFDSDTQALKERETVNAEGALHSLENWILHQVKPVSGMKVLDLGCGTGKQVFALAPHVTPAGSVTGLDVSKDAVQTVIERAGREGLTHVHAVQGSLDDSPDRFAAERFDLIVSSYAFYYSRDMNNLFTRLRSLLNPHGQMFVCGPGDGTNQEIIEMMNRFLPSQSKRVPPIDDFMHAADLAVVRPFYAELTTVRLQNQIRFLAPEPVLQWWRHHNSYRPEIDGAMAQAIQAHFKEQPEFLLSKNVLGVHGHV